jgi:hypothetical protein
VRIITGEIQASFWLEAQGKASELHMNKRAEYEGNMCS